MHPLSFALEKDYEPFDELAGFRRLAVAVIAHAAKDAGDGNQEAITWLIAPETDETWLTLARLDISVVERWVKAGCKCDLTQNGRQKKIISAPGRRTAQPAGHVAAAASAAASSTDLFEHSLDAVRASAGLWKDRKGVEEFILSGREDDRSET
jgi:hypothetical protein